MGRLSSQTMLNYKESANQYNIAASFHDTVDADESLPTVLHPFAIVWHQFEGDECVLVSAVTSNESLEAWIDCFRSHLVAATYQESPDAQTKCPLPVCGGRRLGYGALDPD